MMQIRKGNDATFMLQERTKCIIYVLYFWNCVSFLIEVLTWITYCIGLCQKKGRFPTAKEVSYVDICQKAKGSQS